MSKELVISTIGSAYHSLPFKIKSDEAVLQMATYLKSKIKPVLCESPDLIVLPECCDMPPNFSSDERKQFYKDRGNTILDSLSQIAEENHCYVVYPSIFHISGDKFSNTMVIIDRKGNVTGKYHKNYPTISEMETGILCGKQGSVIQCDFGSVGCAICFDLNFEELRYQYMATKPDLLIFSSMWHSGLVHKNWAYSCQSYLVSSIGGLTSSIVNPLGETIAASTNFSDYASVKVNLDYIVVHRNFNLDKIKAMKEKYGRKVKVQEPEFLGSVLISSETNEFTAHDLVHEFKFELFDDYMNRSKIYRNHVEKI